MDCSLPVYSRHTSSFTTYSALPSTYTRVHAHTHTYGSYELAADTPGSLHPSIHSFTCLLTPSPISFYLTSTHSFSLSVRPSAHCIVLPLQISLVSVLGTWQHVGTNRFHYTVHIPLLRRLYFIAYVIYRELIPTST